MSISYIYIQLVFIGILFFFFLLFFFTKLFLRNYFYETIFTKHTHRLVIFKSMFQNIKIKRIGVLVVNGFNWVCFFNWLFLFFCDHLFFFKPFYIYTCLKILHIYENFFFSFLHGILVSFFLSSFLITKHIYIKKKEKSKNGKGDLRLLIKFEKRDLGPSSLMKLNKSVHEILYVFVFCFCFLFLCFVLIFIYFYIQIILHIYL